MEIIYPDHYNYKKNDIDNIKNQAKKIQAKIITTEKDYVKISKSNQKDIHFLKVNLNIKNERTFINLFKNKNLCKIIKYLIQFILILILFLINKLLGLNYFINFFWKNIFLFWSFI